MEINSKNNNPVLLIVDDMLASLGLAVEGLESNGYKVFITQNRKEAVYYASQIHPDLILLNARLPDEDGFEICRFLRSDPKTSDISIMLMIPEATCEYKAESFAAGCSDYIAKPLCFEEVLSRVSTHIELANVRRKLEKNNTQLEAYKLDLNVNKRQLRTQARLLCNAEAKLEMTERRLEKSHIQLRSLLARNEAILNDERCRIAREIHDDLGQLLTALKLGISTLNMQFGCDHAAFEQKVTVLFELVDQAISAVRNVSTRLRPVALDMGIIPALQWLVDEFKQHSGVSCDLKLPDTLGEIDEVYAIVLFRTVQEALTNITRHAEARFVEIVLNKSAGGPYLLEIKDDGVGFNPTTAVAGHFGLIGMRERIDSLGGTLLIESTLGVGTFIRICIPDLTSNGKRNFDYGIREERK